MEEKVALVIQGGGTRACFSAGVLDVLMEKGISFPYLIGTSAGALSGLDVLSGDIGRNKFVSCDLVRDRRFLSLSNLLFRKSLFDFDYLFNEVPKTKAPFNMKAFEESKTDFYIGVTSLEKGEAAYFKKGECKELWKALAASASQPLVSKPVIVEGKPYLDGGPTCGIPFRKPYEDGYRKIVVIATRDKDFRKKPTKGWKIKLANKMYGEYPSFLSAYASGWENYNKEANDLIELENQGIAFVIRPKSPITIGTAERSKKKLYALYEEGRKVANESLTELGKFLNHEC